MFSDRPLENETVFEIRIDKLGAMWTGSLSIGVTSHVPPTQAPAQISELRNHTVYLSGSSVFKDDVKVRNCSVSLDRLQVCIVSLQLCKAVNILDKLIETFSLMCRANS